MLGGIVPVKLLDATSKTVRLARPEKSTTVRSPTKLFDRRSMNRRLVQLRNADGSVPVRLLLASRSSSSFGILLIDSGNPPVGQLGDALVIKLAFYLVQRELQVLERLHVEEVAGKFAGELPNPGEMTPLSTLTERSRTARAGQLTHKDGIVPWKLLLLAFSDTRRGVCSQIADGNCPAKRLLDTSSTSSERPPWAVAPVATLGSSPERQLLLTSTTVTLGRKNSTSGKGPERLLLDRLRYTSAVRLPIDGEIVPPSPRPGSDRRVTSPSPPHPTPSQVQQSGDRCHSATMPSPARDAASARKDSNAFLSTSTHAAAQPQMVAAKTSTRTPETTTWQLISSSLRGMITSSLRRASLSKSNAKDA
uniref:Uncharacterized protein n=1 Tax=Oryza glumipatula TaxID=40148 RepID=A0A0E0ADN3_9ORYZ